MRRTAELLRREPAARLFFLAHAQSSLGTGAAYVSLLLVAYERFPSPWAISLVLLADFLPPMLLGPVFGAAADRWSRRRCAIVSDLARAVAFVALGVVESFEATFTLALLAGAGTGLFTPSILSSLPRMVARERLPAATSLFGAIADFGHTVGPALAAVALLVASPTTILIVNGASFAVSALILSRLSFGAHPRAAEQEAERRPSLFADASRGLRATAAMPSIRIVLLASSAVVLFAGLFNVGELLLAREELEAGPSGYSVLVAIFGFGVIAGSLTGSRGGTLAELKRRYLLGLVVVAVGFFSTGVAPVFASALATFAVAGLGNGLVMVHERLLIQNTVSDTFMGRAFGVKDSLNAGAFAIAYAAAGGIASLAGTRPMFLLAGAGVAVVWIGAAFALRRYWTAEVAVEPTPAGELAMVGAIRPGLRSEAIEREP